MKLFNFFFRRNRLTSNDKIKTDFRTPNELIDSRFGITKNDAMAQKNVPNSLLFLMYSQENEPLFV